jgi:hypothetical protein
MPDVRDVRERSRQCAGWDDAGVGVDHIAICAVDAFGERLGVLQYLGRESWRVLVPAANAHDLGLRCKRLQFCFERAVSG